MSRLPVRILVLLCVVGGLATFALGVVDALNFSVDDSFISLRVAENWASGHGAVFNPGERVEGYSNFLWTAMLAGLAELGVTQDAGQLNLLVAAKIAGVLFGLASLLILAWLTLNLSSRDPENYPALLPIAVFGVGSTYTFSAWVVSGMETGMCAFFVTLAATLMLIGLRRYDETGKAPMGLLVAAGIAFGILSLVRPEQIFIWTIAMVALLIVSPAPLRRGLLLSAIPTVLIHAALVVWRVGYYGTLVPNTVVAKSGGGLLYAILGTKYALAGIVGTVGILALGLLLVPALYRLGTDRRFLVVYTAAFLFFIVISGGDWMPGYRFFVPVLPLLWLLCTLGVLTVVKRGLPQLSPAIVVGSILLLGMASFFQGRALMRAEMDFPSGIKRVTWTSSPERIAAGYQLRELLPAGTTLAISECGIVPYCLPQVRIFDVFGLMTPEIARLPGLHTMKLTAEVFLREDPEYYLMMVKPTATKEIMPTHPDGVTLLASSEFKSRYEIFKTYPGFVLYRRTGKS